MYPVYDTQGNITAYYDDNMLFYDVNQNPITNAAGQQLLYDPTTNSAIDPATAYGGPPVDSTQAATAYNGNTPPASFNAGALLKTLTGQTYRYNAQGQNPVLVSGGASSMSQWLLYGGLGLIGYIALTGGKSKSRGRR